MDVFCIYHNSIGILNIKIKFKTKLENEEEAHKNTSNLMNLNEENSSVEKGIFDNQNYKSKKTYFFYSFTIFKS